MILKDEVHRVVGCAMEVLITLGHVFHEKPYENSQVAEFGKQGITFPGLILNFKRAKLEWKRIVL